MCAGTKYSAGFSIQPVLESSTTIGISPGRSASARRNCSTLIRRPKQCLLRNLPVDHRCRGAHRTAAYELYRNGYDVLPDGDCHRHETLSKAVESTTCVLERRGEKS
jgi:hypothetical protein